LQIYLMIGFVLCVEPPRMNLNPKFNKNLIRRWYKRKNINAQCVDFLKKNMCHWRKTDASKD